MASYGDLDGTFQALADPTRRQVLERLGRGPATVTELAKPFDMALPSFMQHLKVLEQSRLVSSEKRGRVRTFRLEAAEVQKAEHWLQEQRSLWERRLNQLDAYAKSLSLEEEKP